MPSDFYYIDGPNLETATAIYTDAGLSVCAPGGYYSDGVVTRRLIEDPVNGYCYLQAAQLCESCAEPCGGSIDANGAQGIYKIELDVGGTPTDVGAMIIQINPKTLPDGVLVEYGGVVYNKGVRAAGNTVTGTEGNGNRNAGGLAQSLNANNYTVIGNDTTACGLTNGVIGSGNLSVYNYVNGNFVSSGTTEAYTISLDDLVLQAKTSQIITNFVMVVPKTSATPSTLLVKSIGTCTGTAFDVAVSCPTPLTGFAATVQRGSFEIACNAPLSNTLYAVKTDSFPNAAPTTTPVLRDQVFTDSNGSTPVADGFYAYGPIGTADSYTFQTESGVVIDIRGCAE